jgi:hypothetical protein
MLNENYDYEKIEKIEKMLSENVETEITMSGTTENAIIFENSMYEVLGFYLKVDKETYKILDIEITYSYCDIPRLKEIVKEEYTEMLENDFR